jgi:hypothetical protein
VLSERAGVRDVRCLGSTLKRLADAFDARRSSGRNKKPRLGIDFVCRNRFDFESFIEAILLVARLKANTTIRLGGRLADRNE